MWEQNSTDNQAALESTASRNVCLKGCSRNAASGPVAEQLCCKHTSSTTAAYTQSCCGDCTARFDDVMLLNCCCSSKRFSSNDTLPSQTCALILSTASETVGSQSAVLQELELASKEAPACGKGRSSLNTKQCSHCSMVRQCQQHTSWQACHHHPPHASVFHRHISQLHQHASSLPANECQLHTETEKRICPFWTASEIMHQQPLMCCQCAAVPL